MIACLIFIYFTMDIFLFTKLAHEKLINEEELRNVELQKEKPASVYWDLRALLYLGIILVTTATGILVYKNIDTLNHEVLVIIMTAVYAGGFTYCLRSSKGYSNKKVESPDIWFDYVLLLSCLLLLTFIGYIQFQYNVFGNRWGLAAFIPLVILFIAAYYFDHLGVLSLAITNLATWIGISVTPLRILRENDFNNVHIIYAGIILGVTLVAISFASRYKNIKAHFAFTYKNFGIHILFISMLALLFYYENTYLVWFIFFVAVSFLSFRNALKENSFYFLVITLLYGYIGISYVAIEFLSMFGYGMGAVYPGIIYFILSGIGMIRLFIHYNKIVKNAGVSKN